MLRGAISPQTWLLPIKNSLSSVVIEQVWVDFIFDLSRDEIVQLGFVHGELPNQWARYVHTAWTRLEEDGLSVGQPTVNDTHGELAIKVRERAHTSDKEVNVLLLNIVSQESLNSDDLNLIAKLAS